MKAGQKGPPRLIGGYVLEKALGKGGMGTVYLARRKSDSQPVALKLLNPSASEDKEQVTRFKREAQFMLQLNHPNMVKAYEVGASDGYHWLAMEYVPGETMRQRISRDKRIEPREALGMLKQIAAALDYGAKRGVVHRDLKPENILIRSDGVCKLSDMGLAILSHRNDLRLTVQGMAIGTPLYMSPEQARGERDIDTRSDVYSLGCAFYHAICGQPPFPGKKAVLIMQQHLREMPTPPRELVPGLDERAEAILWTCLQKEREERFQTCDFIVQAIDKALAAPPAKRVQAIKRRRPQRRAQRERAAAAQAHAHTRERAPAPQPGGGDRMMRVLKVALTLAILLLLAFAGALGWLLFYQ